jgi:transposase
MRRIAGEFREKHTSGAKVRFDFARPSVRVETPIYQFCASYRDFALGVIACILED